MILPTNNMKPPAGVFIIAGPSGSGKNTLIKRVIGIDNRLTFVSSLTTRPMRSDESQRNPYQFVTKLEFRKKIENDELLEWQIINGYFYGCSRKEIENALEIGADAITDLDVIGVHEALIKLPTKICTIFIASPSRTELIRRINARHKEKSSDIEMRMKRAEFELSLAGSFDYLICNDDLQTAGDDLLAIIRAHRAKKLLREYVSRQGDFFYDRTISFKLLLDPDGHNPTKKDHDSIELPKTRLGGSETKESVLKRLIRMLSFQSSIPLNIDSFFITDTFQELINHDKPQSYIEYKDHCHIRPNSRADGDRMIKAIKSVNKRKQIE